MNATTQSIKYLIISVFLTLGLGFLSCGSDGDDNGPEVPSKDFVKLDKDTAKLYVNEQIILNPTFSSEAISQKLFKWTTDKSNIVKIEENEDKSVTITALGLGKVMVKIEAVDESISDSCLITVSRNANDIVRVLAIGNSFTVNAMNEHFYKLAISGKKKVVIARLTKGGQTLQEYLSSAKNNLPEYNYWKIDENGAATSIDGKTMAEVISDEKWDYISFQQQSERGDEYDECAPYIPGLIEYVKNKSSNPNTQYVWFQYWPFALNYTWNDFDERYGRDQLKMLAALVDVGNRCSKLVDPNMLIFPFGTTIQNVRSSSVGDNVCADGYHLNTYGCFTVSCTWYEAIFGDVINNPYKPAGISDINIEISKYAAKYAVAKPRMATDMTDFKE